MGLGFRVWGVGFGLGLVTVFRADLELDGGQHGDGFGSHVDQQHHQERVDCHIHTHHLPFGGGKVL